ncbi:MAG: hypothetical protein ACI39Q_01285 [Wujia sp.]
MAEEHSETRDKDIDGLEQHKLDEKEQKLRERLARIESLEKEIRDKEKAVKEKEKAKKQVLLRLAPSLWEDLAQWADQEYRSINSQIEYLLAESVKEHKKK